GILVDSAVGIIENVHRRMASRPHHESTFDAIADATAEAAKPVLFCTIVILVAFLPLFTMRGVPGKIFAPMSLTYGFALTGALLFALVFAPVIASWTGEEAGARPAAPRVVNWLSGAYARLLPEILHHRRA